MATKRKGSTFGGQIIGGLASLRDALKDGASIEERFTVRTVELDLEPQAYDGDAVRRVRRALSASQAVFAKILGVSRSTVQAWEQGDRTPSPMASRFLDEIDADADRWRQRLLDMLAER